MTNALTIDVEDYFHPNAMDAVCDPSQWPALPQRVEANTHRLLEILAEFQTHATCFVLGWVAERYPALVGAIVRGGHEVACHGYAHRLAYRLGAREFRRDVERAHHLLEDLAGAPVRGFRAASYSITGATPWAFDVLIGCGFAYDASVFPIRHDLYGMPRFSRTPVRVRRAGGAILELPASTVRLFGQNWPVAGGGYFRLLPYALTRCAIRRLNHREHLPAIVDLHPWELDVEQPRLRSALRTRLRQYTNLKATEPRLRRLLGEFAFAPIRDVYAGPLRGSPCPTWDVE